MGPGLLKAATGSVADQLADVAGTLRMLADLPEAEYTYPRWGPRLQAAVDRAVIARRRGGHLPGVAPAIAWIDQTMREGFWAQAEAEPLRSEVERCLTRIRQCL
jgi:hypothetical protein